VEDWLVADYLVLGLYPLQHWMLLAVAVVIISVVISAWHVHH
jgi:hypothetical protein